MSLASQISALATRIGAEVKIAKKDGGQIWQTYTTHAVGNGQMQLPWVVPYDLRIERLEYYSASNGSGGSCTAELRKGSTMAGATAISGSSGSVAVAPTAVTGLSIDLNAGELVWVYQTAVNTTTIGNQLMMAWRGKRR